MYSDSLEPQEKGYDAVHLALSACFDCRHYLNLQVQTYHHVHMMVKIGL